MSESTRHPPTNTAYTRGRGENRHSHFEYGSTQGRWDQRDGTDFVITSVNVPDRLDTQEVRNRAAADAKLPSARRFHRDDILRAVRWGLLLALVVAAAWWTVRVVAPVRAAISPAGIQALVGQALGVPVSVADTALQFSPSPRLVVTDLFAQSGFRLPKVEVQFNWRDALHGLQTSTWVLGEARIAPLDLNGQQALALLQSIRSASGLPAAVSTIRFESVGFPDLALLPGRYEAVIRRGAGQREFTSVNLKRLDGDGEMELDVAPSTKPGDSAAFTLFATRWAGTVGPAVVWNEATARGEFRADLLKVDSYSVGARFGNLNGAAALVRAGQEWRLSGNVRCADLSVGELIRHSAGLKEADVADERLPLRGTAKFDLGLSGSGATVAETLRRATASGPGSISGATLGGLNLGLAATQGNAATAGGTTRLTDLDFDAVIGRDGLAVRSLSGRSGSLRVAGSYSVDGKLGVSGLLRPEVASPRGVASAQIQIGGTVASPIYR